MNFSQTIRTNYVDVNYKYYIYKYCTLFTYSFTQGCFSHFTHLKWAMKAIAVAKKNTDRRKRDKNTQYYTHTYWESERWREKLVGAWRKSTRHQVNCVLTISRNARKLSLSPTHSLYLPPSLSFSLSFDTSPIFITPKFNSNRNYS